MQLLNEESETIHVLDTCEKLINEITVYGKYLSDYECQLDELQDITRSIKAALDATNPFTIHKPNVTNAVNGIIQAYINCVLSSIEKYLNTLVSKGVAVIKPCSDVSPSEIVKALYEQITRLNNDTKIVHHISLALDNDRLYDGCVIKEIRGKLYLETNAREAVNTVNKNINNIISSLGANKDDVVVLHGDAEIWIYLIVYTNLYAVVDTIAYDDGKEIRLTLARQ